MFEIVGREAELACLDGFVEAVGGAPAAVLLEGEAGIGKSTLWRAGVERACAAGILVLSSRPAEAERGLAYVGLGDLLEDVIDDVLPALSIPRRRAMEVALLRDDASRGPADDRALAVAVRDVLQLLSGRGRVLIAVDDVQWLDAPSSSALAFAMRRLDASDVLVLLARRPPDGSQPSWLDGALDSARAQRLAVGPLSVGAMHQFLRDRLGRPFARQTLLRIHDRSGGNPFFALELARVLDASVDPLEPLPVPETLDELLRARMAGLPAATSQALALAAAIGTTSESLLERAGVAEEVLGPAVEAQVIERRDGTIRFTHPLLSSVLYRDLGESRRSVHAQIAAIVEDPLVRARHLALSKGSPDLNLAGVLDQNAQLAIARGAPAVAAELAEHAARLTPADAREEVRRRALVAARAHKAAGEWTRAQAIAAGVLAESGSGSWRVEAHVLLAELEGIDRAAALLQQALPDAAPHPALQSAIHCRLAWATRFKRRFDHARAALELADELDDDVLRAQARAVQAILDWFAGKAQAPEDLPALVQHLPEALGGERLVQEATQAIVNTLAPLSRRDEARALLERERRDWLERDELRSARALWGLAWVEFWAGHWELAADHAAGAQSISIQYGLELPQDHLPIAVIAAHRGQFDLARAHSERALELAQDQLGFHPPQHMAVLALVALGEGDPSAAALRFESADRQAAALGWGEPSVRWWSSDYAELMLELGRIADATRILDDWEADAKRVARHWVLAHVTRCRGLLAAAEGDVDRALVLLSRAVDGHESVGDPFGQARALLALGTIRRRARQKRPAREAIEAAVVGFETIGAAGWAQIASRELGRVGGRQRAAGLTPAERRVAILVARGQTNREVAATLFLGERTVASHLTHIYAKLGVRSRTELAHRVDADELGVGIKDQTF